jgi:phosphate-selective porin
LEIVQDGAVIFRICFLLPLLGFASLFAAPRGYTPIISNDLNTSAYDWNAFNTRWVNMRALAMVGIDATHFYQGEENRAVVGDMSHYNRWDVRGLRIGAAGTLNFDHPWTYLFSGSINSAMQDYNSREDDAFTLLDALIGIPLWGEYGRLQIGKMKAPISMERVMGMVFEQVMERPAHLDALLPSRNIGISLSDLLLGERLRWRIGVYNDWLEKGAPDRKDANLILVGRVSTVAYEAPAQQQLLHLGAGYRYEKVKEGSVRYDVGPEFYFCEPWLDTGIIPAEHTDTWNLELSYLDGPLWIASEYTQTIVDSPEYTTLRFSGYHVAVNYFLTGEHRGYNKRRGTVRRITPVLDFDKGGWGAVEASLRYSKMDLDDKEIHGGEMGIWSLGLIWHPRKDHQFHLQWSHTGLDKREIYSSMNTLQARWVWVID